MELIATFFVFIVFVYLTLTVGKLEVLIGVLLASSLLTLPLVIVGNSVNAAIFSIDCLLVLALMRCCNVRLKTTSFAFATVKPLIYVTILCVVSGVYNYLVVDSGPLKFYFFTSVKFIEYVFIAILILKTEFSLGQFTVTLKILVYCALFFQLLLLFHLLGIIQLDGRQYFGARASQIGSQFDNPQYWFLTAIKPVIGGISTIHIFIGLLTGYLCKKKMEIYLSFFVATISAVCVFLCTSRSDMAGLIVGLPVSMFLFYRLKLVSRFKLIATMSIVICLVVFGLIQVWSNWNDAYKERVYELVDTSKLMEGTYRDRSIDQKLLPVYLSKFPREFFLGSGPGNFRSYQERRITLNAMGHNSYLHWLGEFGILGLFSILWWCSSIIYFFLKRMMNSTKQTTNAIIAIGLGVIVSRCVAAWGAESIWGVDGMGYYSLYFVGIIYLFVKMCDFQGTPDEM